MIEVDYICYKLLYRNIESLSFNVILNGNIDTVGFAYPLGSTTVNRAYDLIYVHIFDIHSLLPAFGFSDSRPCIP